MRTKTKNMITNYVKDYRERNHMETDWRKPLVYPVFGRNSEKQLGGGGKLQGMGDACGKCMCRVPCACKIPGAKEF